ncbi:UNVERIFIED_CONTAM: hypothetical protein FKN15_029940 [Acipenser sinensis]
MVAACVGAPKDPEMEDLQELIDRINRNTAAQVEQNKMWRLKLGLPEQEPTGVGAAAPKMGAGRRSVVGSAGERSPGIACTRGAATGRTGGRDRPGAKGAAKMDDTEQGKASRLKKAQKDDEEQMAKYRELLKTIQKNEKKHEDKHMEMEIKWVSVSYSTTRQYRYDADNKSMTHGADSTNEKKAGVGVLKRTAEQLVKKKLEGKDNLTPWEMFLEKKEEKKKLKKKADVKKVSAEDDLSDDELPPDVDLDDPYFAEEFGKTGRNGFTDDEDGKKNHFNYDKIVEQQNLCKKKQLLKQEELLEEDEFQVDVSDRHFQAIYTSHLFNLDPSDPRFKKTKATQSIVEEKMRQREEQQQSREEAIKRKERELGGEKEPVKTTQDPGLSMLIKSISHPPESPAKTGCLAQPGFKLVISGCMTHPARR